MVHLWNNIDSHGLTEQRLDFWEGATSEKRPGDEVREGGNDQGPH